MILSFNPAVPADRFIWERDVWTEDTARAVRSARAVILPQTVGREGYFFCRKNCRHVFPNYDLRFQWEGKFGDTLLFWTCGVPHPETLLFPRVETLTGEHPLMGHRREIPSFPFVLKGAHGGDGSQTWLIRNQNELDEALQKLTRLEWRGVNGFIIQEYLPGLDRDLRVVVIGETILSYWRCRQGEFRHNLAMGGTIDYHSDPELQEKGRQAVKELCRQTGINLAGFDLVFAPGACRPLFLEINYTFGRTGIGGSDHFYSLLNDAVNHWVASLDEPAASP